MTDLTLVSVLKNLSAQIRRVAIMIGLGVAALAAISLLTANPLTTFMRLIAFVGVAMLLFSVAVMLLTFRRAREIVPAALLASLVVTLVSTFVSLALTHALPSSAIVFVAVLGGALVGAAWSLTTLLFVDGAQIRMCGTVWYLAVWALTLSFNQGATLLTGRTPVVMTVLTLVGTGLAIGNTLGLIVRARQAEALPKSLGSGGHA